MSKKDEALKLAQAVIDAARAAMDESFEAGNEQMDISIPAHLAAALSLRLDEYDREALAEQPAQQEPIEEFAYKAITKRGEHCHFGTHTAARIWAGEGGKVETIKLRHLELVEQPAQQQSHCDRPCGDIKCAVMCKYHEQPVQQQQEPVAFIRSDRHGDVALEWDKDEDLEGGLYSYEPLYTSPPASKPLHRARINSGYFDSNINKEAPAGVWFEAGVRFAEAAHGIKGETK